MPKAVVRIEAEARLANGPPRSPPTSPPAPRLTSTKTSETTRLRVVSEVLVGE